MILKSSQKQQLFHSVMSYINLSLFTIIGITLVSIFFSFWMTEQADSVNATLKPQIFAAEFNPKASLF